MLFLVNFSYDIGKFQVVPLNFHATVHDFFPSFGSTNLRVRPVNIFADLGLTPLSQLDKFKYMYVGYHKKIMFNTLMPCRNKYCPILRQPTFTSFYLLVGAILKGCLGHVCTLCSKFKGDITTTANSR